jgi:transcription elongation factor Elf1
LSRISRARAEVIARSHACVKCGEYSYKKLTVREASPDHEREFNEAWHAVLICGICEAHQELGIDAEGEILYAG